MARVVAKWVNGLGENIVSPVLCTFSDIDDSELVRHVVVKNRIGQRVVMRESEVQLGIRFDDGTLLFSEEWKS
jgi:hypothetical protein